MASKRSPTLPLQPIDGDPNTPRALLPKGSPEWCYRTVARLKWALDEVHTTEAEYDKVEHELVEYRAWEKIPTPENHYESLDAMLLAEIGIDGKEARRLKVQQWAEQAKPLPEHGEIGRGRNRVDNVKSNTSGGNSAQYLADTIKRDHPEIHQRMLAGEFRSVRAAALEAGIVKPTMSMIVDPAAAARILFKRLGRDGVTTLIAHLQALLDPS